MYRIIRFVSILAMFWCSIFAARPAIAQISPTNTATITGSILDSTGHPVGNVAVSLIGPKQVLTHTDVHGQFVFIGVPFGTYTITADDKQLGTVTRSDVDVEGDANIAIQFESANTLKVIANVSSSTTGRFNITPASITRVSPSQAAFQGETGWRTLLNKIPGISTSIGYSGVPTAVPDSPLAPTTISINGALPYETAVLLDDMPLIGVSGAGCTTSAGQGTSLSLYPLNAFSAGDVVRGPGAAAPSIVDSIGGSFLLHPAGPVTKNVSELSVSNDPYGGIIANVRAAMRWHKLSITAIYGINDSPGPQSGAVFPFDPGTPTAIDGLPFSCAGSCVTAGLPDQNYTNDYFDYHSGFMMCCVQDRTSWSQHSGSLALNYALSREINVEVSYVGLGNTVNANYPNWEVTFDPPAGYMGSLTAGPHIFSGAYPSASGATYLYHEYGSLFEEKVTAQLGKGRLQLAALQNDTYEATSDSGGLPVSSQFYLYGGGTLNGMPAVFNGGLYAVTNANALPADTYLLLGSFSHNRDFSLNYTTPLGRATYAGASYVQSYYNAPDLYVVYNYFPTTYNEFPNGSSQNGATTDELRLFFGGEPSANTSLDLSGYFVNLRYHVINPNDPTYSSFVTPHFTYAAPRLGFVWRPTAALAVRAAIGGGFAEAPVQNLVASFGGVNGAPIFNPTTSTYSVSLTNVNLRPETSFAFDVGGDLRLQKDTTVSLDLYRSTLYGQLYNGTNLTAANYNGTGFPLYTTQYENLGVSRYEGVLLDIHHDSSLRGWYWNLSGGFTRAYLISVPAGFYNTASCTMCTNLYAVPNINFNGEFQTAVPYSQAYATIGYRWSPQRFVDLVPTYYGDSNSYFQPAFVELDGHLGIPMTPHVSLLATFRNITGRYDLPLNLLSSHYLTGAPSLNGPPFAINPEQYGPRTVIITLDYKN